MDIGREIRRYRLASPAAKKIIGRRLLKAGVEMDSQIKAMEKWLTTGDRRLPQDRRVEPFSEDDERKENLWLSKHEEMVRLMKMRAMIQKEVLGGDIHHRG